MIIENKDLLVAAAKHTQRSILHISMICGGDQNAQLEAYYAIFGLEAIASLHFEGEVHISFDSAESMAFAMNHFVDGVDGDMRAIAVLTGANADGSVYSWSPSLIPLGNDQYRVGPEVLESHPA